jgi:hypothetical protein
MLKKIKSIFVVESEIQEVGKDRAEQSDNVDTGQVIVDHPGTNQEVSGVPEVPAENRFLNVLADAIEKSNQPGFDYLEFRQSLINLGKLNMDEATRFKSAYAAAQAMGVTPATLINSANTYLGILEGEGKKFAVAEQNQRTKVVEERKTELNQIQAEIQKKQETISRLQAEVEQWTKNLEDKKAEAAALGSKLEQTKVKFEAALRSLSGQIKDDVQKMNQYLK